MARESRSPFSYPQSKLPGECSVRKGSSDHACRAPVIEVISEFMLSPIGLAASGALTHKSFAEAQVLTGPYEGIDEWASKMKCSSRQRKGSRRSGEGASRYETCDH